MHQNRRFSPYAPSIVVVTLALLVALGATAQAATLSFSSTPNQPIPDGQPAGVFDAIVVPDNGQILDVNVDLLVGHPFVEDLVVTLQHDGVFTELWVRACGPQADLDLTFDDEGAAVVCATPIAGLVDPTTTTGGAGQLNVFDGLDVNGQWDIQVADVGPGGGNGFFVEWRLHVEVADPPVFVPPPDLKAPGCRGADNPLYASPCRGGGSCSKVPEFGMSRTHNASRDHMSRMASRASMLRLSDDDSGDDDSLSISYEFDDLARHAGDDDSDSSMMYDDELCGGPVSSPGGVFRFSGEYHRTDVDMVIPGRGHDVVWSRTYRSRTGPASPLGQNWDHGYNIRLFTIDDGPSEADQLVFPAKNELVWSPPADAGGDPAALRYCTLRADDPRGFAGPTAVVLDPEQADTSTIDQQNPAPGQLFSYLILPKNGTRPGPLGTWSDGTPRVGLDCGATGPELILADGTGRRDLYTKAAIGPVRWMAPEMLSVFTPNPDGSFTLTFPDTGRWIFNPPAGLPEDGKIASIVDRNGNTISFGYDPAGNLTTVTDTLGRDIDLAYNPDGFLESVTDFTGRQVVYDYYGAGDPDGSPGDLRSVRSPIVAGTSTGNDFPSGKTTTYTYSTGFTDQQLNHNLLTISDPKGQVYLQNVYSSTADPAQLDYDRVVSQTLGDPGDRVDYTYLALTPGPSNDFATTRVIENDRVGNVRESFFDDGNRMVRGVSFTGRAPDADLPTGDATNRPVNQLRVSDPPFYEMRWSYNDLSRVTEVVLPNESAVQVVYDDLNADRRSQANPLSVCRTPGPLGGAQPQLCDLFEYDTASPTSSGTNFVTRHVDARGHETLHVYDGAGNRTQTTHRIPSIVEEFEYNSFGQLTAHVHPDNGSAHRRRDEYSYHPNGPQTGYLSQAVVDVGNFALTTTFEYDARGNLVRTVDPRGADTLFEFNQLDQVVRGSSRETQPGSGVRYDRTVYYDANDNVVRVDIDNRDETGVLEPNRALTTVYEYDILDRLIRSCSEDGSFSQPIPGSPDAPSCATLPQSEFIVTEFEYDANRNLTLARGGASTDGSQPTNTVTHVYDERDLVFETVRAAGDPDQSTTRYDYDANGNTVRVVQGTEDPVLPREGRMLFDGYDRLQRVTDPMDNATIYAYDENDNVVQIRVEGELDDAPGASGNVRLFESTYVYDDMDRRVVTETEHFDGDTQVALGDGLSSTIYDYTDTSHVRFVTDDTGDVTGFVYDTANRLLEVEDSKTNTRLYEYDANSNVTHETSTEISDLGLPDEVYVSTYSYDGLDRTIAATDAAGNTVEWLYDSRDNVRETRDATTGAGSSGNVTRFAYDGVDRLVETTRVLTADGTGGTAPVDDITTSRGYDDSGRLVDLTDDAGNVTSYVYDALDRRVVELHPDGTQRSTSYDVHDNVVLEIDPNGSRLDYTYDLLDRATRLDVTRGTGVGGTTFETYAYDGLSRLVRASDDDSLVERSHDSLSHVVRETLDGEQTQAFHDGDGNRTQSIYPGGRVLEFDYDALDRLTLIQDGATPIATYQYVGPGTRVQRRAYGNGTQTLYTYDGLANPPGDSGMKQIVRTQHVDPLGVAFDDRIYAWDPMQNKIRHEDVTLNGPGTVHDYEYDSVYRLTRSTRSVNGVPPSAEIYAFDGVGNRTSVTGGPDPGPYVLDPTSPVPADEQVNQYTNTPFDDRLYDDNGNTTTTSDPAGILPPVTHVYDYADRLIERSDPGRAIVTTYDYDALGRRTRRTVTDPVVSTETRYYYDGHRVCEEQDGAGATTATYVYGLYIDEVLQREHSLFGSSYFHTDDLYNTIAVTDATGGVRERYEYEEYGRPTFLDAFGSPQASSPLEIPYLFTGRRYDDESGLYWFRTRYMDPRAGRFTSRDTLGAWGDPGNHGNGQTYAGNNPATLLDPFGDVPIQLAHQGRLMDGSGHPVSGPVSRRAIIGADSGPGSSRRVGRSSTIGDYATVGSSVTIRAGLHGGGGAGGSIYIRAHAEVGPSYGGGSHGGRGVRGGDLPIWIWYPISSGIRFPKVDCADSADATYKSCQGGFGGHAGKKDKKRIAGGGGGGGTGSGMGTLLSAKGDDVSLVGFGSMSAGKRAARTGRNPQTGKEIKIAAKNVVKFKAGADLSKKVN